MGRFLFYFMFPHDFSFSNYMGGKVRPLFNAGSRDG